MYIYHLERNGVPFYVGRTSDTKERLKTHQKRFGNDISIVIIKECDYADSMALETLYIKRYLKRYKALENKNIGEVCQKSKKRRLQKAVKNMTKGRWKRAS